MATDRRLRVLIVDDETVPCDSTALLLKLWGFDTVVARNGAQALQAARLRAPDIILLCMAMPADRLEVAQRLREQTPPNGKRAFIIALSGNGDAQLCQGSQGVGIDLYCVKPLNPAILEKALARGTG
jgi:two-component system CheB/CheR fusion protein